MADTTTNSVKTDELNKQTKVKKYDTITRQKRSKRKIKYSKQKMGIFKKTYEYSGIVLAICATIYLTTSYFMMKLAKSLNPAEMSGIKFFITLLLSGVAALCWRQNPLGPKESRVLLILRGICGSIALILNYFSIRFINYSDSTVLRNCSPLLTALFASIFLKELLNISHIFSAIVTVVGVLFICRPEFIFGTLLIKSSNIDNNSWFYLGICLAILSTIFFGSAFVFIKKLNKIKVHFSVIIFYLSSVGFIISVFIATIQYLTGYSSDDYLNNLVYIKRDAVLAAIAGLINFFGHYCLTRALVKENSNTISFMRFLDIIVAFFLEYILSKLTPDLYSISGASFIVAGLMILFIYKCIVRKSNEVYKQEQKSKQKTIYRI